jgi:putative FmdB family regulatory protein
MPIYAYRCESCGHAKDVLQRLSDPVLTVCPACGEAAFHKQVTAAGFQLKGSGWYVTDFRGDKSTAKPEDGAAAGAEKADGAAAAKSDSSGAEPPAPAGSAAKSESAPAPTPAAVPAPPPPATPSGSKG